MNLKIEGKEVVGTEAKAKVDTVNAERSETRLKHTKSLTNADIELISFEHNEHEQEIIREKENEETKWYTNNLNTKQAKPNNEENIELNTTAKQCKLEKEEELTSCSCEACGDGQVGGSHPWLLLRLVLNNFINPGLSTTRGVLDKDQTNIF